MKTDAYIPCCGDTLTFKRGTLPMGSCDLHMLAPEMLAFLKEMKANGGPLTKLGHEQLDNLLKKAGGLTHA